jgi:hypothetical protein
MSGQLLFCIVVPSFSRHGLRPAFTASAFVHVQFVRHVHLRTSCTDGRTRVWMHYGMLLSVKGGRKKKPLEVPQDSLGSCRQAYLGPGPGARRLHGLARQPRGSPDEAQGRQGAWVGCRGPPSTRVYCRGPPPMSVYCRGHLLTSAYCRGPLQTRVCHMQRAASIPVSVVKS